MRYLAIGLIALVLVLSLAGTALAEDPPYLDTPDTHAIRGLLARYQSPLPWWTVAAFKYTHPDFDVAAYFAVMWSESSLGTTGGSYRYNNPGNIKFGGWLKDNPDLHDWHRWMNGTWYCRGQGTYGTYSSMYWGQRAAIRLLYDAGYNATLAAGDYQRFANRYYGSGVAGVRSYAHNVKVSTARFAREAREWGAEW